MIFQSLKMHESSDWEPFRPFPAAVLELACGLLAQEKGQIEATTDLAGASHNCGLRAHGEGEGAAGRHASRLGNDQISIGAAGRGEG